MLAKCLACVTHIILQSLRRLQIQNQLGSAWIWPRMTPVPRSAWGTVPAHRRSGRDGLAVPSRRRPGQRPAAYGCGERCHRLESLRALRLAPDLHRRRVDKLRLLRSTPQRPKGAKGAPASGPTIPAWCTCGPAIWTRPRGASSSPIRGPATPCAHRR